MIEGGNVMNSKMKRLLRSQVSYNFSRDTEPICHARNGETLMVETPDCFGGAIGSELDTHEKLDLEKVNGAVGPIYVEGAEPGGCLKVSILNIRILSIKGVMMTIPGFGLLKEQIKTGKTKICRISSNRVIFNEKIRIPLRPMIGTIGVAPAVGSVSTISPEAHGGNLDTKDVRAGSSAYFPVTVEGALLGVGDCHAVMGDGEICVTGVEVPAQVTLRVQVLPEPKLSRPIIETKDEWMTVASGSTLEEAAKLAVGDMMNIVQRRLGMTAEDAYMFLSAAGDLRISQVVNPLVTVRMTISKSYLKSAI